MPGKRLSLDPIDHSPLGHPMKFTQRSFPFYRLGLHQALPLLIRQFRNWLGSFFGLGLMLYFYLNYSTSIQQILRSVLGSFYPLQKSRINHRFYVWTKALSGRVFAPAQKVSGTLWTWLRQRVSKQRPNVRHTFTYICLPSRHMEDKGTNDDLSFFRTSLRPGSAVGKKCVKRSETA